jgi:hypothetical protein
VNDRREWKMATSDLREDAGIQDRAAFTRALDELQAAMIVMPGEVHHVPGFTYPWTLAVGRFSDALRRRISREPAPREIARCFLSGADMTIPGELARARACRARKPGAETAHWWRKATLPHPTAGCIRWQAAGRGPWPAAPRSG